MRVLVTGENSYAGRQFEKRINELKINWEIDFISVRNNDWKSKDFSGYDAIYHVAGIVHQKETSENQNLYYIVNNDLTCEIAKKAKKDRVKNFIFLSTMAVYGLVGKIGEDTVISKDTKTEPTSHYGKSKLEAENTLEKLHSIDFNVATLRIPMIYGPDCPGNYSSLRKLVKVSPVFPKINNKRSMIFVDYLSDIVIYVLKKQLNGILLIKNPEDINTLDMINEISVNHNKKIYNSILLGKIIMLVGNKFLVTRKMFGSINYNDNDCLILDLEHSNFSFKESIAKSENP